MLAISCSEVYCTVVVDSLRDRDSAWPQTAVHYLANPNTPSFTFYDVTGKLEHMDPRAPGTRRCCDVEWVATVDG